MEKYYANNQGIWVKMAIVQRKIDFAKWIQMEFAFTSCKHLTFAGALKYSFG